MLKRALGCDLHARRLPSARVACDAGAHQQPAGYMSRSGDLHTDGPRL
jgi:hypothetical protein